MTLFNIVTRNLLRKKGKVLFVISGLVLGIATSVAVLNYSNEMTGDINHKMEKFGANILIMPETKGLALNYGGLSLGNVSYGVQKIDQKNIATIRKIKDSRNIAAVGPMLLGVITIKGKKLILAGVDFTSMGILRPWWNLKGNYPNKNEFIAGSESARFLSIQKGSTIKIKRKNYKIYRLLTQTGSQDDRIIFGHLDTVQKILNKPGTVSMVEVAALCTACPINEMVDQISGKMTNVKVMAIQQVVQKRMNLLKMMKNFALGISAVILIIVSFIIMTTMAGNVKEKISEIGIFRAIGFRKYHIIWMIIVEALIITALSGIIGYFVGVFIAGGAVKMIMEKTAINFTFDFLTASGAVLVSLVMGVLSSVYPAYLASKLEPGESLRTL